MTVEDSRRALITYALVSEALDKHNDFLMGLTPLFTVIAEKRHGEMFNPHTFAADAAQLFGIRIPDEVADFIASRLQRDGLLVRPGESTLTISYVWRRAEQARNTQNANISSRIDMILDELVDYAQNFPSITSKILLREELQDGLFEWLLHEDRTFQSAMSAMGYNEKQPAPSQFKTESAYLAASFVREIRGRNDDTLTILAEIANSVVVSEALLEPDRKRVE